MSIVCPTVTAYTSEEFEDQLSVVLPLSPRIHIDIAEKSFTGHKTVTLDQMQPLLVKELDIHFMGNYTSAITSQLLALKPSLVIVHAETAFGRSFIDDMHSKGIKVGCALLQQTPVSTINQILKSLDHVLIFSGSLGSFGGSVEPRLLQKVIEIRDKNPLIEIGWDGGVNEQNIAMLHDGGIDVLNVGGAIQRANNPRNAYASLVRIITD